MKPHLNDSEWFDDDPRWSLPSPYDPPGEVEEDPDAPEGVAAWDLPLPRADRRDLLDVDPWRRAEAALAADLARAAQALGRLDEAVRRVGQGAAERLAYREVEAMLRADGRWLDRDRIGRAQLDAGGDPDRVRDLERARWALRRLTASPGVPSDLRRFLGRHRPAWQGDPLLAERVTLDAAVDDVQHAWQEVLDRSAHLHPITQGCAALRAWRLLDVSGEGEGLDGAVMASRIAAREHRALGFVPLAPAGQSWRRGGAVLDVLRLWMAEVRSGALSALADLDRAADWREQATARVADLGGRNPAKVLAVLAARPYVSAADVAETATVSRDTAERILRTFEQRGLVHEITGRGRFRLWRATV
ncbi:hypothetical protein [Falsirhodobacter sp. 1013]|uniref:hypothetical protein n=1 Tax=Falsirhodobacter sp. 1013 TaxID=3417566 RepID=UPI003EB6FEB1